MQIEYLLVSRYAMVGADGNVSVCGVQHDIVQAAMPSHTMAYVVAQVLATRGEVGPHTLTFRVRDAQDEEMLNADVPFELGEPAANDPSPLLWAAVVRLNLPWPAAGAYSLDARVDGKLLAQRALRVACVGAPCET